MATWLLINLTTSSLPIGNNMVEPNSSIKVPELTIEINRLVKRGMLSIKNLGTEDGDLIDETLYPSYKSSGPSIDDTDYLTVYINARR